jgi:hypothetical protein
VTATDADVSDLLSKLANLSSDRSGGHKEGSFQLRGEEVAEIDSTIPETMLAHGLVLHRSPVQLAGAYSACRGTLGRQELLHSNLGHELSPSRGMTPICRNRPIASNSPQCSAISPSATRTMSMPIASTCLPVAATPMNSP